MQRLEPWPAGDGGITVETGKVAVGCPPAENSRVGCGKERAVKKAVKEAVKGARDPSLQQS